MRMMNDLSFYIFVSVVSQWKGMEPSKAIPKKHFVLEEENNCEEEMNLIPQDRIGGIDWCKCAYECKQMAACAESFCL